MNLFVTSSLVPLLAAIVLAQDQCAIAPLQRSKCGWEGISQAVCLRKGCCYDTNLLTINRCYYKKFDACEVNLVDRRRCKNQIVLFQGKCESMGCCYDFNVLSPVHCYEKKVFNPCANNPCENGGLCVANGASFTCSCRQGWGGSNCQTATDPCVAGPCRNGGICTRMGDSFKCTCAAGWSGDTCQTAVTEINVCARSNPCRNGGTCVKFGNGYICKCLLGWAGDNCEMNTEACKVVRPEMRINCGWGGITQAQCNARSCCYDESVPNRPVCFYLADKCDRVNTEERVNCGFAGITYNQCIGRGCCFDDDEETNPGPVCFRRERPECRGVKAEKRVAKGKAGIQPNECNDQGWCFDSSAEPNCFSLA